MKVSICIATHNRSPGVLARVFDSIFAQRPPFEFEVIVVDDGSHNIDGTRSDAAKKVCEQYPIEYHRIDRPPGFLNPCVPRNVAYRAARGDVVIAQSDEVIHETPNAMEMLVSELESHPGAFVLATVYACNPDGKPWSVYTGTRRQKPWFFLGALWRSDVYAVGGNDEEFRHGPAFDDEWFARCLRNGRGLTPYFTDRAVGHHLYHPPTSSKKTARPNQLIGKQKTEEAKRTGIWCATGGPWPYTGRAGPIANGTSTRISSLVVCVEYDDLLSITLPQNKTHFHRTMVVTSTADTKTQEVARREGCECYVTDAFYANQARFNKGLAIERALDAMGREGWICYWDADIMMPANIGHDYDPQYLYCPFRRVLGDPRAYSEDMDWETLTINPNPEEFPGYFHLFHASAAGRRPWYSIDWAHAGGCDSDFEGHYRRKQGLRRPPFDVLHLGPVAMPSPSDSDWIIRVGDNWCGRVSPRLDTGEPPDKAPARKKQISRIIQARRTVGTTALRDERVQRNIPKRMTFVWNGRMSWLRWVCLHTFVKLHPDWEVRIYTATTDVIPRHWQSDADDDHEYQGEDYLDRIPSTITRHTFEVPIPMAAPQMGGWFRWQVLADDGGFYADTDFVWIKSLDAVWEQARDADALFCLESGYLAVGFMGARPGCRVLSDIAGALSPQENTEHQFYGVDFVYQFANVRRPFSRNARPGEDVLRELRKRYEPPRLASMEDSTVYPFDWRGVHDIWSANKPVDDRALALHWFGGSRISRTRSHALTADNWCLQDNTMSNYLRKVL